MRVPAVVAPTMLVFAGAFTLGTVATWLALGEHVSPLVTVPMHVVAMFALCIVLHETLHHAAGRLTWVNEVLGRIVMPFVSLFGAYPGVRYVHLEYQRAGGGASGWYQRGPRWQWPLRWALTDLWYAYEYLRRSAGRPQLEVAESLAMLALMPSTLAAVVGAGRGLDLLLVYLLPQRIAVAVAAWWADRPPRRASRSEGRSCYRYERAWRAEPPPVDQVSACPMQFRALTVSGVRALSEQVTLVEFEVPDELRAQFAFAPGQHVVLRATVDGEPVERSYAICCLDGLRVAVKLVPGGRFSSYAATLRVGDRIDVRPPSGTFTVSPGRREAKHYVAIVAGIGIAPVLPMLAHALGTAPRSRATLLYVNRSGADTLFAGELTELVRRFDGRLRIQHFRTDERDPDLRPPRPARPFDSIGSALAVSYERYRAGRLNGGRLRALLDSRLHPAKVDEWLLCAPAELADPLHAVLTEHGVPAGAIRQEGFSLTTGARATGRA